MNSISGSLTPKSIVSTAKLMRSARNEIILIVEGDDDIALFSSSMNLPRANFISCSGKERLMDVFQLAPVDGLDSGTILFCDKDCQATQTSNNAGVFLFTSDRYDFEMSLLPGRVFSKIFREFFRTRASSQMCDEVFNKICNAASVIGALRHVSYESGLNLKFKDYNLQFVDTSNFSVDVDEMIRYFLARSQVVANASKLKESVAQKRASV